MAESARTLRSGFLASCERTPERPALEVEGRTLVYRELRDHAARIAATLARDAGDSPPLTAVLAQRSVTAFAGVLGALFRGHGYVPLNPSFPPPRTIQMLERSGCQAIVVDTAAEPHLEQVLGGIERPLVVLLPDREDASDWAERWPLHRFVPGSALERAEAFRPALVSADAIAYLLFTSGSTGTPKGVMVAHRNVLHFLDVMVERYRVDENDRFTQLFDLTFDLSAFDMFLAWERGACLCCPSLKQKMVPSSWLAATAPTIWFSVPSTGVLLQRLRKLEPGAYPSLRLALFCGEPLPAEIAAAWAAAAPNATIENLYGPTEVTIACTAYRWDPARSAAECDGGVVPIGEPYPGMDALVVDESLHEVAPGDAGELLMSGPQVALGYWKDREKTDSVFVVPPGRTTLHYRTGDRVRRPLPGEPLRYLGRVDHQIKIQGYRVELGEIEAALRDASGASIAIAIGWPAGPSGAEGVVAFLGKDSHDVEALRRQLAQRLPAYMVPREIRLVADWPLNANGKIDRHALRALLDSAR